MIRRATVTDVPAMGKIINDAAEFGLMLPKSMATLYENVREFHVAVEPTSASDTPGYAGEPAQPGLRGERVIGVCGLSIVWANLAEAASLAVDPAYRGKGIGRKLVEACIEEARQLGVRKIMTLTYEQAFFEKLGFVVLDREQLPHKVWSECVRCPKNQACDEIAMVRVLEDVPEIEAAPAPRATSYEVPVVLTRGKSG